MSKFDFDNWIETHDGDDYCHYCKYNDDCTRGMVCYGGAPIEPPCCIWDIKELLDEEAIIEDLEEIE